MVAESVADDLPVGRCEECGDDALYLDRVLLDHFSLNVCISCKQDQIHQDGAFELLSKSRARTDYALPDSSFSGLPHLSKPNPRHEAFAPLQLYLRRTLVQEAYRLYGDEEGLQREKSKRKKRAFRSAAGRTKHLLKKQHLITLEKDEAGASEKEKPKKKKPEYVPVADKDHRHSFGDEKFDEQVKVWMKHCACGMQVQFEKW
ncbi:DNA repair protein complementing XP-A cells [Phytophthora citrophthora]|uniref:DNA repair protein complementing XP-A cells n=1 Tax=Phytophthora citrophthora TaxID=4793 RepID=A0AAD9GNI8_9STRA|nr:DNA repair protein complementing XP-A cells [Phytophthora citrophthora]